MESRKLSTNIGIISCGCHCDTCTLKFRCFTSNDDIIYLSDEDIESMSDIKWTLSYKEANG